jgi:hypothetical protein
MLGAKPVSNPIQKFLVITNKDNSDKSDFELVNVTEYKRLISNLIYLTNVCPDIAYTVSCLSQFMHGPLNSHLKLAFRLLHYLKGAPGKGNLFCKSESFELRGYSDLDRGKCLATSQCVPWK